MCHTAGMSEMPFLLPDLDVLDPAALKAMIYSQHEELLSHRTQIEHLKLLIAKLRRMQFGRSSEKVERQIEQLELQLEELEADQVEAAPNRRPSPSLNVTPLRGSGGRCPTICLAKCLRIFLAKRVVPLVVAL